MKKYTAGDTEIYVGSPFEVDGIAHSGNWFDVYTQEDFERFKINVEEIADPEVPVSVPSVISDRQFFQQLAVLNIITEQEAEDACAAILPASLVALVDMLPEQARFSARMLLKGATEFKRRHEMTDTIAWLYGWTEEQVDAFWIAAGAL